MNNIPEDDPIVGIDLGTRFSCLSIWKNNRSHIIPDSFGARSMPSVVAFYKSAKLVGSNALAMKEIDRKNTIYDIKRVIGRRGGDPAIEVTRKIVDYDIVEQQDGKIYIKLENNTDSPINRKNIYTPEEVCACILSELKKAAQKYTGREKIKAVITVPAYFNDSQKQATLDAGKISGLDVVKIINEPTAAALAYGLADKHLKKTVGGNVVVYDIGAGTLDISVINIAGGVFRTLGVIGNPNLGGEDIDFLLMNYAIDVFQKQNCVVVTDLSVIAKSKLKNAAENAKKILSNNKCAAICVDDFYHGLNMYVSLRRKEFETLCNEFFSLCIKHLHYVLENANIKRDEIDDFILVGGTTKIPAIRKLILKFFEGTKIKTLNCSMNPDEVVSVGAAIYGYIMCHNEDPFSENVVLLDVTPLSLGVETIGSKMTTIIRRNTIIPTRKSSMFTTDTDYQDRVTVKIFEGERKLTSDNFHVGDFELSGFEKAPKGHPQIKITFTIDHNGILQVTALEKRSGIQNTIEISSMWGSKGRLSDAEIEKIVADARKYEEMDTFYSLKIEAYHEIKSMCKSICFNINSGEIEMSEVDANLILTEIRSYLEWLSGNGIANLGLEEMQKVRKTISGKYAIMLTTQGKQDLESAGDNVNASMIHGDEDVSFNEFIRIDDVKHQELAEIKKTISDMCANIVSILHNPVSKFEEQDIIAMTDYMESVQLWLYATNSSSTMEFISKIDEINTFTGDIMNKYGSKPVFNKPDNFTARDELHLTCMTINNSINCGFLSIDEKHKKQLNEIVTETALWLCSHADEKDEVYQSKTNAINELCNIVYDNTSFLKSSQHQEPLLPEIKNNACKKRIAEDIDDLINNLPEKPYSHQPDDIMMKIDISKLSGVSKLNYRSQRN